MVYKKVRKPVKRRFVKRRFYKKRGPQKFMPRMSMKPENKYNDVNISAVGIDNTGTGQFLLNGIDNGDSSRDRIGNKIRFKDVQLNLSFTVASSSQIKIAIVYDKQTNGVIFPMSDYLTAISALFPPWCTRRMDSRNRFVTLFQDTFVVTPQIASNSILKKYEKFKKFIRGVGTSYNGSGSTVGAITTGSLYLVILGSNSGQITVSGTTRLKYTDD